MSTWKKLTKMDLRSVCQGVSAVMQDQHPEVPISIYALEISSSPAIWQCFIEQDLAGMDGPCVIMDDLFVGDVNDDEYLHNLQAVFLQFQEYRLRAKLLECQIMTPSVIYFGLRFSKRGIQPGEDFPLYTDSMQQN